MASLTVENYLKTIYQIINSQDGRAATTGQVAAALGVAPGTVTSMLKTLDAAQLAAHRPYEGVVLLPAGQALALRVLRRHRLLELFLMRTLGMSWDEVHDEAEHMEHAVSDLLVERIDTFLGRPEVDPHGDPIPRTDGKLREGPPSRSLADCQPGEAFSLARVLDQSPEFLRYLTEMGLSLGVTGTVAENPHGVGLMLIDVDQRPVAVSLETASSLAVTTVS
jgi:DtxR family Mn-dependent transcriptional regulator